MCMLPCMNVHTMTDKQDTATLRRVHVVAILPRHSYHACMQSQLNAFIAEHVLERLFVHARQQGASDGVASLKREAPAAPRHFFPIFSCMYALPVAD